MFIRIARVTYSTRYKRCYYHLYTKGRYKIKDGSMCGLAEWTSSY